jgi:hypothetical protein
MLTIPRKLRLAAFFRTSSNGQEREETIRRQFDNFTRSWELLKDKYDLVPRYAGANFTDTETFHFVDDGYNLEEWNESTAFHDLMSRCKRGEIDAIWTSETDRIVRSRSNELRGRILDIIQRSEVKILTKTGEVPSAILLSLLSSLGAEDKRAIMLKCQEGKITRAERDGHPPSGKIPFGFSFTKRSSTWAIVPEEAIIIRSAVSLMIGRALADISPSVAALAQFLQDLCVPTLDLNDIHMSGGRVRTIERSCLSGSPGDAVLIEKQLLISMAPEEAYKITEYGRLLSGNPTFENDRFLFFVKPSR